MDPEQNWTEQRTEQTEQSKGHIFLKKIHTNFHDLTFKLPNQKKYNLQFIEQL